MLDDVSKILYRLVTAEGKNLMDDPENKETIQINDIRKQKRGYSTIIPIVFGEMLLAGNIIWIGIARKHEILAKKSFFSNKILEYTGILGMAKEEDRQIYFINIAIAICEGVVDELIAVYVNGVPFEIGSSNIRFYDGSETQMPDKAIEKECGIGKTPGFRGLCYIVFEDFSLEQYSNRIPKFEFLIRRTRFGGQDSLSFKVRHGIKGINLIPGSGEFVYDTKANLSVGGFFYNEQNILDGEVKHSNTNTFYKNKTDAVVALDLLKQDLPNLNWVSVVVSWFSDSLEIGSADIFPAVEFNDKSSASLPIEWACNGKNRWEARTVSKKSDGSINYGGTVCDSSLINILKELKLRGYKICLYPLIFVDLESKPWRGRITGKPSDIPHFFQKAQGYDNFIMHYATISKNLVDVFVIGSEMKGLTSVVSENGTFPAVLEFARLAERVKGVVSADTKITYAADWSEYHSINGVYNMDDLWASSFIDFIGIDAYFPLTDTKNSPSVREIKEGWSSGEGYDYYYMGQEKVKYQGPQFAWKNVRWFLENDHVNPDGKKTKFVPKSKKVWFMEYGFPSVDLCSNQPNIFYDPSSSESGFPKYSSGFTNFAAQKEAIFASLQFIEENNDIIENAFVWCYDLRPYPFFPKLSKIWNDGKLWYKGHWLSGKLGNNSFKEIVSEIAIKAGLLREEMKFFDCEDTVESFCINSEHSAKHYINILSQVFSIKSGIFENGICFKSSRAYLKSNDLQSIFRKIRDEKQTLLDVNEHRRREFYEKDEQGIDSRQVLGFLNGDISYISSSSLIKKGKSTSVVFETDEILNKAPLEVVIFFIDKAINHETSNYTLRLETGKKSSQDRVHLHLPLALSKEKVAQIASNILKEKCSENVIRRITLSFEYHFLRPCTCILLEDEIFFIDKVCFDENWNVILDCHLLSLSAPPLESDDDKSYKTISLPSKAAIEPVVEIFHIPNFFLDGHVKDRNLYCVSFQNIDYHAKVLYKNYAFQVHGFVNDLSMESVRGKIIFGTMEVKIDKSFLDNKSYIEVYLEKRGTILLSAVENLALIGGEICFFEKAVEREPHRFAISQFVRTGIFVEGMDVKSFVLLTTSTMLFLPSYLKDGLSFLVSQNSILEKEIPIKTASFKDGIFIGDIFYNFLKDGILFWWQFVRIGSSRHFEYERYEDIEVEISFRGSSEKILTKGESYVLSNSMHLELDARLDIFVRIA